MHIESMQYKEDKLLKENGACKFCGQYYSLEYERDIVLTTEELNETATLKCNCDEAKEFQFKHGQKIKAKNRINKLFGNKAAEKEVDQSIVETLHAAVEMLIKYTINSISIDIGHGIKAKLSMTAKGLIKVERNETVNYKFEE